MALWLVVALAIPRVIRLLYPAVWIEDDSLLETTLLVSRGFRPFLDFTQAQMPLLEWVASGWFRLAGASTYSLEILNGAAIYATSVLIVLVGRRAVGYRAAVAGALLFACSSLVFRYHLWTREFFVSALVLSAALVILKDTLTARFQVPLLAVLLSAACAIKLTSAVTVMGLIGFMALGQRRPLRALVAAAAASAALALFAAFCYWRYGFAFVFQAFLFHFLKGTMDAGIGYAATILDVLAPLFIIGAIALAISRAWNRGVALVLSVLGPLVLFYGVLSPTAWGHNYLDPLPWMAVVAGGGLCWLIDECRRFSVRAVIGLAFIAASLIWVTPLNDENSSRGSVYGFGFVPRTELTDIARALRQATRPDEEVVAPAFVAFEANRVSLLRFPENYGVMREGEKRYRADGFWAARNSFGRRSFFDLINETSAYWNDEFARAIATGGPVNAVILDSPIQLMPLVDASDAALVARGFTRTLTTPHFALWLRGR